MKKTLSSREKKIISFILDSYQTITISDIAEALDVSRRTILREMPSVYTWFDKHQAQLNHQAKKGLYLDISELERSKLKRKLEDVLTDTVYTQKERQVFIASELLQSSEPLKLFYFSETLNVSEATISHDLDKVEAWLEKYHLKLERKPGSGIELIGEEKNIRQALVAFIYETLDGDQIRDVVNHYMSQFKEKETSAIENRLLKLIDAKTISIIEQAILSSEEAMGFTFAESSYTALAVHLALAISRLRKGDTITLNPEVFDDLYHLEEYSVAKALTDKISKTIGLTIPKEEVGYVTMHLRGARYKSGLFDASLLKFNELIISNYQLTIIIKEMIKYAKLKTNYPLDTSDSLLVGLVEHLRPAINRIQMNLEIRNPLLEKIKEDYPAIYEVSTGCAKIVEDHLNLVLPESEIGYIALHIGSAIEQIKNKENSINRVYKVIVTCISGIGTSKMLAERIKKEFSNIQILEVFSTTALNNAYLDQQEVDLIISTVHFEHDLYPVVLVNPLLPDNDIEKIKQRLNSLSFIQKPKSNHVKKQGTTKAMITQINHYTQATLEILDHLTLDYLDAISFDVLMDLITSRIHKDFKLEKLLKKDLLRREAIGSIIFEHDQLLFLHTRSETINTIQIKLIRLI